MCVGVGGEGHFVVFSLYTCRVSWLQTHYSSNLPIHSASSGPKDQRTKSEHRLCPWRRHLQVHVNFHQAVREEGDVRMDRKLHGSIRTKQAEATLWTRDTGVGRFTFTPKSFSHLSTELDKFPKAQTRTVSPATLTYPRLAHSQV